ncbi:MAG: HEAT repeat domain-containing protein [bacterium]
MSRKLILLCILYFPLLPILYAVVLLRKPRFENHVAKKELFDRLWKKRLSKFDGRRIRAELALKNHLWGAEVIEPLVGAIKNNERVARELLGEVVDRNAIPQLLRLLEHKNSDVRESATAALARIANGPDNSAVMELFDNMVAVLAEGHVSTSRAIDLFATLEGHRNRSRVLALAAHRRPEIRHLAVSTLHRMWKQRPNDANHTSVLSTLVPLLRDPDNAVRAATSDFLGEAGEAGIVETVRATRDRPYWEVRTEEESVPYFTLDQLENDIVAGRVTASSKICCVEPKASTSLQWEPLSESLAKEYPSIGKLFEPYSYGDAIRRGARTGVDVGAVVWLAVTTISITSQAFLDAILLGPGYWLAVWTGVAYYHLRGRNDLGGRWIGGSFLVAGLAAWKFAGPVSVGDLFVHAMHSFFVSLQIAVGAILASTLICVWPGMLIGSLGGIVATRKARLAPVARRIPWKVVLGGIVFPVIAFALAVWGYVEFLCWWMSG